MCENQWGLSDMAQSMAEKVMVSPRSSETASREPRAAAARSSGSLPRPARATSGSGSGRARSRPRSRRRRGRGRRGRSGRGPCGAGSGDPSRGAPRGRAASRPSDDGQEEDARSRGSVRVPASRMRRISEPPQPAREVAGSCRIERQPTAMPIQNRKAKSQERKNWSGFTSKPGRAGEEADHGHGPARSAARRATEARRGGCGGGSSSRLRRPASRLQSGATSSTRAFWLSCSART